MDETTSLPQRLLVGISLAAGDKGEEATISSADLHTAEQAIWLASRSGGKLRFLHVFDFFDHRVAEEIQNVMEAVRGQLGGALEALVAQAADAGVQADHVFTQGKPWFALLREADRFEADLIVVSPRRHDLALADRLRHGSTSRHVIRRAKTPVWVVEPSEKVGIHKILALVDRSDVSPAIIRTVQGIADASGAERLVLHCMDYPDDVALHRLPHAHRAIASHHEAERQRARKDLAMLLGGDHHAYNVIIDNDWIVRAAPKIVDEQEVDLVVVANLSRPALATALLGSTVEKLLNRTHVSTWIVRAQDLPSPSA